MHHTLSILILAACYYLCHAQSTNSSLSVSEDGACGASLNHTCLDSTFGSCCSLRGFCGSTNDFCNPTSGCQSSFGNCSTSTSFISYDGRCGSNDPNSQVCVGSTYGSCCSQKGWCGGTIDYCGVGCQSDFGTCGGDNATVETNTDEVPPGITAAATSTTLVVATSTSVGSSSTSRANPADSAGPTNSTASSSFGFKIAIGVLCGLLAALSVFLAVLLMKRHSRKHSGQTAEKSDTISTWDSFVEAPSTYHRSTKDSLSSTFGSLKQHPVELGSTGYGRAELRESYIEIDSHRRW